MRSALREKRNVWYRMRGQAVSGIWPACLLIFLLLASGVCAAGPGSMSGSGFGHRPGFFPPQGCFFLVAAPFCFHNTTPWCQENAWQLKSRPEATRLLKGECPSMAGTHRKRSDPLPPQLFRCRRMPMPHL